MTNPSKTPGKKLKLSAHERLLLRKIKKSEKSSWMIDKIYNK